MRLDIVRGNVVESTGAIPGRLYVDGEFFGYTLERSGVEIAPGNYSLYTRFSPKFATNKLAIEVPGRQYLMFHGGNHPEDSAGCVIVSRQRVDDSTVYGDLSTDLYKLVKDSAEAGNATVNIRGMINYKILGASVFIAAAALLFITR